MRLVKLTVSQEHSLLGLGAVGGLVEDCGVVRGLVTVTLQLDFPLRRLVKDPDQDKAYQCQNEAGQQFNNY